MKSLKMIGVIGALALAATACSASVNTEPDEAVIAYHGASGSATAFSKCIPASRRVGVSMSDNTFTYPFGQRTYDFTGGDSSEAKPLSVVSKDNVELTVGGVAMYSLNTDCKTLQQFHERIGLKLSAYLYGTQKAEASDAGWRKMLGTYFRTPLDRALDAASQEFEWKKLYNDPTTKQQWEARVSQLAAQFIKEAAGGQFFCQANYTGTGDCGVISLTLSKPEPPQSLVDAMAAEQAAKAQNLAQQQLNIKADTELEAIKKRVAVLGVQGYVWEKAVNNGAQVILSPGGAVNITPAGK